MEPTTPLYTHRGGTPVGQKWTEADVVTTRGQALYTFADDVAGEDPKGENSAWTAYTGETKTLEEATDPQAEPSTAGDEPVDGEREEITSTPDAGPVADDEPEKITTVSSGTPGNPGQVAEGATDAVNGGVATDSPVDRSVLEFPPVEDTVGASVAGPATQLDGTATALTQSAPPPGTGQTVKDPTAGPPFGPAPDEDGNYPGAPAPKPNPDGGFAAAGEPVGSQFATGGLIEGSGDRGPEATVYAPTITQPTQDSILSSKSVTVAGLCNRGKSVLLQVDGADANVTADIDQDAHTWTADLELADGPHEIVAQAVDADGNASAGSELRKFTVHDGVDAPSEQDPTDPDELFAQALRRLVLEPVTTDYERFLALRRHAEQWLDAKSL